MIANTSNYSSRMGEMNTSSMLFPTSNTDFRKNHLFPPMAMPPNSYPNKNQSQGNRLQVPNSGQVVRAEASRSMIDLNTAPTRRQGAGKLEMMGRNVVSFSQNDDPLELKHNQSFQFTQDDSSQKIVIKKIGPPPQSGHQGKMFQVPETKETEQRKRRESIDLGMIIKKQRNNQFHPFLRKQKAPEQAKVENPQEAEVNTNGEPKKHKNFQFLKKRRETLLAQQSTPTNSMTAVQSMKDINQYEGVQTVFKKPQFLSPTQNKYTPHFGNTLLCPEQKTTKVFSHTKGDVHGGHGLSPHPNFQFKKKKIQHIPIAVPNMRLLTAKQSITQKKEMSASKQISTLKQKWMKVQRQIKLQDFEMLQKLGKGAFGDVYIARQKAIGFICVIKKMSKKRIKETKVEEHILRQIKIQSYLSHANLTALFGYFHDEEYLYLILEALPDGSLQQIKKKKKLPQKEAASIIKQVTDGLRSMHEQYIIHRDLKPQNLFVNEGVIKIGDFGCSIYNRDLRLRNTVVGCLEYSSPEQLSKEGYSQKIDSWSLGILTYELLFGKSPFESEIIKMARNNQFKPELNSLNFPSGIPIKDHTKRFIENLLEADPDKRMDMDEVLEHPFLSEEVDKKPTRLEQL